MSPDTLFGVVAIMVLASGIAWIIVKKWTRYEIGYGSGDTGYEKLIKVHSTKNADLIFDTELTHFCTVVHNEIFQPRLLDGVELLKLQTNLPHFNRIAENIVR